MQIDPYLSSCIKLNYRWIKELNLSSETLNLIEEKMGNNLELNDTGKDFLNRKLVEQALRSTISK